jgi:FdhD protein
MDGNNGRMQPAVPLRRNVATARMTAVRDGARFERTDRLAGEEPMEIRAGGPGQDPVSIAVTMRTPGSDFELAAGFLFTEGLVSGREEILSVAYCDLPAQDQHYNVVTVRLSRPFDPEAMRRNFYATSSCGVCGKASLDQVRVACRHLPDGPVLHGNVLASLPGSLREAQRVFEQTGGLHAAGLFDIEGRTLAVREDVGRHNAVDKLAGWAVLEDRVPLTDQVLMVSGRIGFEIVQKAAVAGIPILCAVSAPSSLAVDCALEVGMTLAGFVRGRGFNVYSHPERIAFDDPEGSR